MHEGGLLTGDIAARRGVQLEVRETLRTLVHRALDDVDRGDLLARDAHGDFTGSNGARECLCAVQHEVRVDAQQRLVLVRGGFTLHGVDHDVLAPCVIVAKEFNFPVGRKAGPTTTAQSRCLQ